MEYSKFSPWKDSDDDFVVCFQLCRVIQLVVAVMDIVSSKAHKCYSILSITLSLSSVCKYLFHCSVKATNQPKNTRCPKKGYTFYQK